MNNITPELEFCFEILVLAVSMLLAWEVGKWMGRRLARDGRSRPSKFDDVSMALLGLLLAFSFGMAISKHDQRRIAVVTDANAIGDFYTAASLLKEPVRAKLQTLIRQYTQLRLDIVATGADRSKFALLLAKSDDLHNQMTVLVEQALADGTPIAVPLTNTLNAMISSQASRVAAVRDRLPSTIVFLLFVSAVITSFLVGREQGGADTSEVIGTICFILLVSIAVYVTLDLNSPEIGQIQANQEPIERLLATMPK